MRRAGRGALFAFGLAGLFAALGARPQQGETWTVVLTGDTDGYLAPCGCTEPMTGGLKRRATALRSGHEHQIVIDNGGLSGGTSRQNVIKAETSAQALELHQVSAANFTGMDASLGAGEALSLVRLAGNRLISTSLEESPTNPLEPWRETGPFLIGGATSRTDLLARGLNEPALSPDEAADRLIAEATVRQKEAVLLFDGPAKAARELAVRHPKLRLVTYRATGKPPTRLETQGDTALATPGERGKAIVKLTWQTDRFLASEAVSLGPEVADDPAGTELYKTYLSRVVRERLLEKVPRLAGPAYAGSAKCASCHTAAGTVWKASGHAHAYATLEKVGHDRDPDCVACHVVGLERKTGFRSRQETPGLAQVGCESCHGAGAAHAAKPFTVKLPKLGERACASCHTLENSPNFDYRRYWPKVRHGFGGEISRRKP